MFPCQRWRLACEGVEDNRGVKLLVVEIGELQRGVGEVEAVKLDEVAHPAHDAPVAVGHECLFRLFAVFQVPVGDILVSYHHQHVARAYGLLPVEYAVSYTIIIYVGPLVGSCYHDGLVEAHLAVA